MKKTVKNSKISPKIILGIFGFLLSFALLSFFNGCNYDRATFLYNDITPEKPSNLKLSNVSDTSATLIWSIADDQAYPSPTFSIYTIDATGATTNLVFSSTESTNQGDISGLSSGTFYSAFVRSTNRAGHADSTNASFTTD